MPAREHEKKLDPASVAVGTAGAGALGSITIPRGRRDLTNKAKPVHAKLKRRSFIPGGHASLTGREFAEVNGGRGYRAQNDAYTSAMALAMKKKHIKQNRLVMDVYDNAVLQRDGAHRAQARVMLGEKVKVKAVRHKGRAPRYPSSVQSVLANAASTRQRKRLRRIYDAPPTTKQLKHEAKKLQPLSQRLGLFQSNASKSPLATPKRAGLAGAAATAGIGAVAAVKEARRRSLKSREED